LELRIESFPHLSQEGEEEWNEEFEEMLQRAEENENHKKGGM